MKAECLWEISRICVSLDGTEALLLEEPENHDKYVHGTVKAAQADLTLHEAKEMVKSLQRAVEQYEDIEKSLEAYMENQG